MCWRVGNGEDINVWDHKWVEGAENLAVYRDIDRAELYNIQSDGYHWLQEERMRVQPTTSNAPSAVWDGIWKAPALPPNANFFIWRAYKELLPVRANLVHRGVCIDTICPMRQREPETVSHMLLYCPLARGVWFSCHR